MEESRVKQKNIKLTENRLLAMPENLGAERSKRINALENYDLSLITNKFSLKYDNMYAMPEQVYMVKTLLSRDITPDIAKKLENDFKKWISLSILEPDTSFGPINREMDMYWHLLILHTNEYNNFVKEVLGRHFGHQPTNAKIREEVNKSGDNTRRFFKILYGNSEIENLKLQALTTLMRSGSKFEQQNSDNPCQPDGCNPDACNPDGPCIASCKP